jgi:hypothetical protein
MPGGLWAGWITESTSEHQAVWHREEGSGNCSGPLSYCDPIRTAAEGHKRARAIEGGLQIGALLPVVDDDRPESLHRRNAVVLAAIEVVASL